jgi:hypothetical protein
MRTRSLIDEGLICEDPASVDRAAPYINRAWNAVVRARNSFQARDWTNTDHWARTAALTATKALVFSRGYKTQGYFTMRDAREYCRQSFGAYADQMYTRVELIGEFLPLPDDLPEKQVSLVGKTVSASSEFVSFIEGNIATEKAERQGLVERPRRQLPYRW